jgi:hypothetical protein
MCRQPRNVRQTIVVVVVVEGTFPLSSGAPPNGDTGLTHVMRLATHSTTSPTPTVMGQLFIMTCIKQILDIVRVSINF